jgi:hypothetical protein
LATLLVCIGIFLAGLVGEYFLSVGSSGGRLLAPFSAVVPNFQFFWPADALTQGHPIPLAHVGSVSLYATCLIAAALSLAIILFQSRDVG